jgi:GTPase SAR1 family protein
MFSRSRKLSIPALPEQDPMKEYRICVIGSSECGKSALVTQYFQHKFLETYTPTVLHSFSRIVSLRFELLPIS